VADQSKLSTVRDALAELADPKVVANPAAVQKVIADLGIQDPKTIADVVSKVNAQGAAAYQDLVDAIDAYLDPLISTASSAEALKLACPLGLKCPLFPEWPRPAGPV
jgi:hypothetical protein